MEADLADAKRSVMKLKQRIGDARARNSTMQSRLMTLMMGQQQTPGSTSPRAYVTSSAGGDYSLGHSSSDDTPVDQQQVKPPPSPVL